MSKQPELWRTIPAVRQILELLLSRVQEILREEFYGLYLSGSLAGGDSIPTPATSTSWWSPGTSFRRSCWPRWMRCISGCWTAGRTGRRSWKAPIFQPRRSAATSGHRWRTRILNGAAGSSALSPTTATG